MTKIHHFTLSDMPLEVRSTTDILETTAITCAQDALPWLQSVPEASSKEQQSSYQLTCLLCQTTSALSLIEMQEHLMEQHHFTQDDLAQAIRVHCTDDETLYIWTLPPGRAMALKLPQLSYLRAVKHGAMEPGDLEVYLSGAIRLGTHFDTISGIAKINEQSWLPVMVCGKQMPERFHTHKVVILLDEPCGREEAASIAWRSHPLFHTKEAQDEQL